MKEKRIMVNPHNPFSDFEEDYKKSEKAENSTPGRVPPATYKFVLSAQEVPANSGTMVDHEVIVGKQSGTKGFKLFCEILEPETVPNPKTKEPHITKGTVIDHVFWITQKNLPYIKRDISTILGRDVDSLGELTGIVWAGRTFEGVVKDEEYLGRVSSRIAFITTWAPAAPAGANPHGAATSSKDVKVAEQKADPKKTESKSAEQGATKSTAGGKPLDF